MKSGFRFNEHNRDTNPRFESHDPGMMWDPASGKYYSFCTDSYITSKREQGIPIRVSDDLVDFRYAGTALSEAAIKEASYNGEGMRPVPGFWAPFTEYSGGKYRMYYSATKAFGTDESKIWLAVSDKIEGPYENVGVVVDSRDQAFKEKPNAIDPHIVNTPEGGKYLIYGSFFGGIYAKELNPVTGMSADNNPRNFGTRLAYKPEDSYIDGPEGPAVIYNPDTGKYYLFFSYGWLGDDYDIRVGISDNVLGPYVDKDGVSLLGDSLGTKLAGSYEFTRYSKEPMGNNDRSTSSRMGFDGKPMPEWEYGGFRGPGHGVPFYNVPGKDYFFVHHVRDGAMPLSHYSEEEHRRTFFMHYMMIRRMLFIDDWPVFSPEDYAGEEAGYDLYNGNIQGGVLSGVSDEFEWVVFDNCNNELIRASKDVTMYNIKGYLMDAYDFENSKECKVFTGYTDDNRAVWGRSM